MNADKLIKMGINLRDKWSGDVKTICPKCGPSRKKAKDPSLSVDIDRGIWNCHHCGWSGSVNQYVRPEPRPKAQHPGIYEFFERRKILRETVEKFGVSESVEWMPQDQKEHRVICFNYFLNGELINIKFKTADKKFKMVKDAQKIPYNIDGIKESDYVIICEGEEEAMVWSQSGLYAISVPNGASKTNNNLDWLDLVYDMFEGKIIYLATDNDEPGRKLQLDISRRFGGFDIRVIEFPASEKDANDCLKRYGQDFVTRLFYDAIPLPIEEISSANDYLKIVDGYRTDGYPVGDTVMMPDTDAHLSWSRKELVVVTGVPGMGKTTWLDYMYLRLAHLKNWKFGIFSPENIAPLKITRLAEQLLGKELTQMNAMELDAAVKIIDQHFWFYNVETLQDYTADNLLRLGETLVKRHGIDCLCLDPFNYIEQDNSEDSSNEKIGNLLRKLKQFAVRQDVNVTLVAHPRKMDKSNGQYNVPRLYDISGSHHFFNVPDIGIAVHRTIQDGQSDPVEVHVQKMKYHFRGKLGRIDYTFDRSTGRYTEDGIFQSLLKVKHDTENAKNDLFGTSSPW